MSVVLVIAVGLFFMRDNIAKFINNAATQIVGEASNDGLNEYGFYFGKEYYADGYDITMVFYEDGTATISGGSGESNLTYSNGTATPDHGYYTYTFSPDGKIVDVSGGPTFVLKE